LAFFIGLFFNFEGEIFMTTSDNITQARQHLHEHKDIESFANLLDGVGHDERVRITQAMKKNDQKAMWELSKGYRSISLNDIVAVPKPLLEVRHVGKNTLPVFSHFEKRFCRPSVQGSREELIGYNWGVTKPLVGPGYFVAYYNGATDEVDVDYRLIPKEKPQDWPEIESNDAGIGKLVFGNMVDSLRRISEHVTIGSAAKNGKPMGNWFILCREA
jgi:hypothetical protein